MKQTYSVKVEHAHAQARYVRVFVASVLVMKKPNIEKPTNLVGVFFNQVKLHRLKPKSCDSAGSSSTSAQCFPTSGFPTKFFITKSSELKNSLIPNTIEKDKRYWAID